MIGYLLKKLTKNKIPSILLSICKEYNKNMKYNLSDTNYNINKELINSIIKKYQIWIEESYKAMIWDIEKIKPHFNGNELAKMFHVMHGKIIRDLQDNQFRWQLLNITKRKEDYEKYVGQNKEDILKNLKNK